MVGKISSIALAAALGWVAVGAGSSEAWAISLEEAAGLAIRTNPEVGVVANDRRAVDEELRQARALYYPQIDLRADTGVEHAKNQTTEFQGHDTGRTQWRSDAALTLSQLLFDGFFASSEVERQQARSRSAGFRVGESAEAVALDAVEAYLEVLRHRERVSAAEHNVQTHRDTLALVERRSQGGGGGVADVRQAQARAASAESALTVAQGDLRDAEALFIRVVGQAPDDLTPPNIPGGMVPATVDDAVRNALESSPTVALARADVETANAEITQQESSLYPDLRLELNASVNDNADGRTTTDHNLSALVVMRWNLYRGGADVARIREFKYRAEAANAQLRVNERRVEEEVRRSWNAVQVSGNNVSVLQQEVTANQQTRDVYGQQFDIGQRGLIDILDTENDLYQAQDALITAQYANLFAQYRLLASAGLLVRTLGLTPPEAATVESTGASTNTGTAPSAEPVSMTEPATAEPTTTDPMMSSETAPEATTTEPMSASPEGSTTESETVPDLDAAPTP